MTSDSQSSVRSRRTLTVRAAVASAVLVGAVVATTGASATAASGSGGSISGQGSTFVSNFLEQCKADVKKASNINVTYQPTGSGAGRAGFIAGTTDFAASDIPFTTPELAKLKTTPFTYVPIITGAVAVPYRVKGVSDLQLSGPTLAKIFSGKIVKWNDSAIAGENPKAKLPGSVIKVVVRSDSSGTSAVFSSYLEAAGGGGWKGTSTGTFRVPSGNGVAQKGSDGVTNYLESSQGEGAITYAELSYATERKLAVARIVNASGAAVTPDAANVTAAMTAAKLHPDGTLAIDFRAKPANAYPIVAVAYVIAPKKTTAQKAAALKAFLEYSVGGCQGHAARLGYAPLPKHVVGAAKRSIGGLTS